MPIAMLPEVLTFDEVLDELLNDKRDLAESALAPTAVDDEEIANRFLRQVSGQEQKPVTPDGSGGA